MAGYIKIYRDILEWEWWSDINTYRLFTYMLLKANWQDSKFRGINIPKGSFVSTLDKLSRETSLTINEVRTAIKHLQSTNEITNKSHGKYTVFTINNYCLYQDDNKQITEKTQEENKEVTNRSQPVNNLLTTIKEYKEDKEEKKDDKQKNDKPEKKENKNDKMSKDNAEQLLNAAMQQEKNTQQRMNKAMQQPGSRKLQKNW